MFWGAALLRVERSRSCHPSKLFLDIGQICQTQGLSANDVIEVALAKLALEDDCGARLVRNKGSITSRARY